jgi:predicted small secreted protein
MKKIISLAAVLAMGTLLLAGCGQKPANQATGTDQKNTGQPVQTASQKTEESFSGSLSDLMKRGQPTKCTFNYSEAGGNQQGEAYISGNSVRVNTKTNTDGKNTETYLIKKGTEYYVWGSDTAGKGTKFVFTEADEKAMQEKGQNQEADKNVDLNKTVDYKCSIWIPDNSLFTVPANIEFQDMTAVFKDMQNQNSQIQQEVCKMCDKLPAGSSKDDCIKTNCK